MQDWIGTSVGLLAGIGIGLYAFWVYPRQIEAKRRAGEVRKMSGDMVKWVRLSGAVVLMLVLVVALATLMGA